MKSHSAEPARTGTADLPDGRALGWAEWGPEDGFPVLLCPGAATSSRLGFGADAVDELGIRLVSADRPGLGASDAAPDRTLLSWPDDVRALGLGAPAVVGFSQGAPFALACAAAGVACGVAVVSGSDELAHPAFADKLDADLSAAVGLARADPVAAEAGFAAMTADALFGMVMDHSAEIDRKVYSEPAFAEAYREALEEAFRQGPAGYARDTLLAMAPWPFDVADIKVPVELWYGGRDTSPVHSPDFGETLARRIPAARRRFDPEAGGALLWTRSRDILSSLLDLCSAGER